MAFTRAVRAGALAAAATALLAVPAHAAVVPAAVGEVVVFTHEFDAVTVFEDPVGCAALPVGSHVIVNRTDSVVVVFADPLCLLPTEPFSRLKPGYGTHVGVVGSFRA